MEYKTKLIVRGGGDLASGVILSDLYRMQAIRCWYWNVRDQARSEENVSFGEAVYDGTILR